MGRDLCFTSCSALKVGVHVTNSVISALDPNCWLHSSLSRSNVLVNFNIGSCHFDLTISFQIQTNFKLNFVAYFF